MLAFNSLFWKGFLMTLVSGEGEPGNWESIMHFSFHFGAVAQTGFVCLALVAEGRAVSAPWWLSTGHSPCGRVRCGCGRCSAQVHTAAGHPFGKSLIPASSQPFSLPVKREKTVRRPPLLEKSTGLHGEAAALQAPILWYPGVPNGAPDSSLCFPQSELTCWSSLRLPLLRESSPCTALWGGSEKLETETEGRVKGVEIAIVPSAALHQSVKGRSLKMQHPGVDLCCLVSQGGPLVWAVLCIWVQFLCCFLHRTCSPW